MTPQWRDARAITEFRHELNTLWPNRDTSADGDIGDTRHQQESSGHNPNKDGVVRADDVTHDPVNGPDCNKLAEHLRAKRDKRTQYVIWNHRIFRSYQHGDVKPWTWDVYDGTSPHTDHLHLSVGTDTYPWQGTGGDARLFDDPSSWNLAALVEGTDELMGVMVPLPDNYPYKDHKPGDLVPIEKYLQIIGHQIFADRQIDQQDLAVDKAKK